MNRGRGKFRRRGSLNSDRGATLLEYIMALSIIMLFAPICMLSLNLEYAFESASEALDGGTEGIPPDEPGGKDKADGKDGKDS